MQPLLATRKRVLFCNPSGFASLNHLPLHKGGFAASSFMAPLCKGGWILPLAKDWGIVFFLFCSSLKLFGTT
jgi:hypothetical protein